VSALRAIDDAVYRAEKAVVAALLVVMGVVVFLDVVHRVGTRAGSLLASPVFLAVAASVLGVLAFRTRGDERALVKGAALGLGITAARALFLVALPNGLVWSQTLALALTLWLGLLGASLAAHERRHLAMDVGSKLWPAAWAGKVAAVGHAITAAFCVLLLWLGVRSVMQHWDLWVATEGAAGNLSGLPIPKWFPAMAVVYGMAVIAFRFGVDAVRAWNGTLVDVGDDTLHQLGISAPTEPR
jgi:TRAP-type C4-dicarboxylate transport system permease small subunit